MLSSFKEILSASGGALCDPIAFGKHRGERIYEIPETYWKYFAAKNGVDYNTILNKINEAKKARNRIESRPARKPVDTNKIKEWLFDHQKEFNLRFNNTNYAALFAGIGTGKTYAILEMIRHRIRRDDKILVLCPKTVFDSWENAINKYYENRASHIRITGTSGKKIDLVEEERHFYITNYESLLNQDIVTALRRRGFSWIIADEAHKYFCNTSTKTYKQAIALSADIEMRYILTGTPRRKSDINLYGLITFLDRGERFGASFYAFRQKYFVPDYMGFNYNLNPSLESEFWSKIKSCSYHVNKSVLKLPPLIEEVITVELTDKAKEYYNTMLKESVVEIDHYLEAHKNGSVIEAGVVIARITKLRQICSGFVNDTENKKTEIFNQDKLKILSELLDSIDEPVIITVCYKEEIEQIKRLLESSKLSYGIISGNISDKKREESKILFSENKLDVMVLQEAAGGVGIDGLQNHCSLMIEYSYGYSYDNREQKIGRIARSGQKKNMRIISLKTMNGSKNTVEHSILESIRDKTIGFENMVRRLRDDI